MLVGTSFHRPETPAWRPATTPTKSPPAPPVRQFREASPYVAEVARSDRHAPESQLLQFHKYPDDPARRDKAPRGPKHSDTGAGRPPATLRCIATPLPGQPFAPLRRYRALVGFLNFSLISRSPTDRTQLSDEKKLGTKSYRWGEAQSVRNLVLPLRNLGESELVPTVDHFDRREKRHQRVPGKFVHEVLTDSFLHDDALGPPFSASVRTEVRTESSTPSWKHSQRASYGRAHGQSKRRPE